MGLPRLDDEAETRPRLMSRMNERAAVTVVHGPMGSGKTTLVAHWAHSARAVGRRVLWLDGVVDSPRGVVSAVAAAIGEEVSEDLTPGEALRALVPALRIVDEPLDLVIDDFDPLADALGDALVAMLQRCRSVHVVICLRSLHESVRVNAIGLSRQVIGFDELAFTADEIVSLAGRRGVDADAQTVGSILDGTRGVTGLVRAGVHEARVDASGPGRWWSWDPVRSVVRDSLRRVIDVDDAAALVALASLDGFDLRVVESAFLPTYSHVLPVVWDVGGVGRRHSPDALTVRIPPILAEVLRSLHDPVQDRQLADLHERVISALETDGRVIGAVELARLTGRHETLLELVKRHWWDIAAHDLDALAGALEAIPDELLAPRSVLMRYLAQLVPDRVTDESPGEIVETPTDLDELRALAEGPDAPVILDAVMITLMAARFRGDRAEALDSVRQGTVMVEVMGRDNQHRLPTGSRRFFVQTGLVHLLEMDLAAAELAFRRGYGPDHVDSPDVLRREAANKLALVHALRGDHERTREWIERALVIDPPEGWLAPLIEAPRRFAETFVALDLLDRETVERHLGDLASTVATDELWFLELAARSASAVLWGGAIEALHALQSARSSRPNLLGEGTLAQSQLVGWEANLLISLGRGTEAETLTAAAGGSHRLALSQARLLVLSNRPREALAVLASVIHTPHELARVRVEALLLSARVHDQLGETRLAHRHLAKAARHPQLVASFASVPRRLLRDHADEIAAMGTVLAVLERRADTDSYPEGLAVVNLTEREQRLLELLRTSSSRDAIARSLFVSTNTVKTQLRVLYRKLGVASRDEAVARAYELGLLD